MAKKSSGILMYRRTNGALELFLVHPGGPFWAKKDAGAWSLPKGEYEEGEDPIEVAKREFTEETGCVAGGKFLSLGSIKQPSGKVITAWAVEGSCDAESIRSNTFSMEWPPKSGKSAEFPEVDRAGWFSPRDAVAKLVGGQVGFVDRLCEQLGIALPVTTPAEDNRPVKPEKEQGSLF